MYTSEPYNPQVGYKVTYPFDDGILQTLTADGRVLYCAAKADQWRRRESFNSLEEAQETLSEKIPESKFPIRVDNKDGYVVALNPIRVIYRADFRYILIEYVGS